MNSTNILDGTRFIAKLISVVLIIVVLLVLFFSDRSTKSSLNPFGLPLYESIMMISFYIALTGLILAWIWEGFGGFLTFAGLICFSIVDYLARGSVLLNIWILAIPAFLFLVCWYFTNISEDFDIIRD